MGIVHLSHVQERVIPKLMQEPFADFQLVAHQESGKTLAYLLPILHRIDVTKNQTQAICVVDYHW